MGDDVSSDLALGGGELPDGGQTSLAEADIEEVARLELEGGRLMVLGSGARAGGAPVVLNRPREPCSTGARRPFGLGKLSASPNDRVRGCVCSRGANISS